MALTILRLPGALLLSAVALAGCGGAHSSARPVGQAASSTAHPAAAMARSPQQRAEADAAAILAAFVVPPGGRKLPGPPTGQASQMKDITGSSASPNWIDKTGFWQVKGDPQQVLAWTAGHVGRSHLTGGPEVDFPVAGRPETVWQYDYTLPPVPAVEDTRELTVEVADAGHGQTAIRVDAQVTWLPARPASAMVPATATTVTLTELPSGSQGTNPPRQETSARPVAVGRITAAVNSLPVFPPGPRECGFGMGADLMLTFLTAPKGRVLATALIEGSACQAVIFATGATKISEATPWDAAGVTALGVPFQGHTLAVSVLQAAGLTWNLPFQSS
jgi:hypothetical protein